jgi:hypothetical protein
MSQFEEESSGHYHSKGFARDFHMPRIDFPKFEGEHPKIWKEKCEKYFLMSGVPHDMWVPFATMHFHSHATYWLQTFEAQHAHYSWAELCVAVDTKFGKEMYHNYMRDLLAIKQTSDVTKYHARFVDAMHKVVLHHPGHDEVLKHDISSVILLHKPRTVDAAMYLVVMQEEVLELSHKRFSPRQAKDYSRFQPRSGMCTSYSSDKGMIGGTPVADGKQEVKSDNRLKDKLANLKAMRKARGECFKCGAKWGPHHKCSANVPIHMMEEVLDILHLSEDSKEEDNEDQSDSDTELLALSLCAVVGTSGKKTMRLLRLGGK